MSEPSTARKTDSAAESANQASVPTARIQKRSTNWKPIPNASPGSHPLRARNLRQLRTNPATAKGMTTGRATGSKASDSTTPEAKAVMTRSSTRRKYRAGPTGVAVLPC